MDRIDLDLIKSIELEGYERAYYKFTKKLIDTVAKNNLLLSPDDIDILLNDYTQDLIENADNYEKLYDNLSLEDIRNFDIQSLIEYAEIVEEDNIREVFCNNLRDDLMNLYDDELNIIYNEICNI